MSVLCACECSQNLTSALLEFGVDAYSCDLSDCLGEYPERHIKDDIFNHVDDFDHVIAFPPCTHLAVSNAHHLREKIDDGRTARAIDFVERLFVLKNLRCLENPVGVIPRFTGRMYSQIVSPEQFGSKYKKRTCLWLFGLPLLLSTSCFPGVSFIPYIAPSFKRSILDPYLAHAMASQWSEYLK